MSSSTTQTTLNRKQLYRLTNQILFPNFFHFITISLLFIPAIFSASAAIQSYLSSSYRTDVTTEFNPINLLLIKTIIASSQNLLTLKTLILLLTFILPTVAGVALITYSTFQAIHHEPLTFSSTLKSLSHSYIPLLHTFITASIALIILFLSFTLFSFAIAETLKSLGFHFGLLFLNAVVSCVLAITILYFIGIWGSAAAITVLESKSGFETLRQSANQSTEFRHHSFYISIITVIGIVSFLSCSIYFRYSETVAIWMLIVVIGGMSSWMVLMYVVANTVLYVQLKVASEAVEGEVSGEYVRLVVDDTDGEVVHEPAEEDDNGCLYYFVYSVFVVWVFSPCMQFYYFYGV